MSSEPDMELLQGMLNLQERDQRRERLLRECEQLAEAEGFTDFAARIRAEIAPADAGPQHEEG